MIIILADTELAYLENLKIRLNSHLSGVTLFIAQSQAAILAILHQPEEGDCLVLFNPADFPDLAAKLVMIDDRAVEYWPIIAGKSIEGIEDGYRQDNAVYRFGKVPDLVQQLRIWVNQRRELPQVQPALPVADLPTVSAQLHMLLCTKQTGYQPGFSRIRLKEMLGTGRRVVYLPLMPTYQMSCLSPPGHGPALSDLLLQLFGQNVKPEQLSQYWQPHPEGYLQFRPPDRSDDLVTCSPDLLRALVNLLRDRLNQDTEPGMALIDCAGLPLASVSSIAVLCDSCEVLLPETNGFAADAARREVSQLFARLPPGCRIRENHQD